MVEKGIWIYHTPYQLYIDSHKSLQLCLDNPTSAIFDCSTECPPHVQDDRNRKAVPANSNS